jgi:hypothetical protein
VRDVCHCQRDDAAAGVMANYELCGKGLVVGEDERVVVQPEPQLGRLFCTQHDDRAGLEVLHGLCFSKAGRDGQTRGQRCEQGRRAGGGGDAIGDYYSKTHQNGSLPHNRYRAATALCSGDALTLSQPSVKIQAHVSKIRCCSPPASPHHRRSHGIPSPRAGRGRTLPTPRPHAVRSHSTYL